MELEIVEKNRQAEKNDWIFLHGSDLLQRSIIWDKRSSRKSKILIDSCEEMNYIDREKRKSC